MLLESALGGKLYAARTRKGLTQAQVAEAAAISVRWYQQLEKGGPPAQRDRSAPASDPSGPGPQ